MIKKFTKLLYHENSKLYIRHTKNELQDFHRTVYSFLGNSSFNSTTLVMNCLQGIHSPYQYLGAGELE